MAEVKKPDFLVIGASRSGTTWLHDNLQRHPQVFIPQEPGEFHFFSKYYDKGFDHYLSHFQNAGNHQKIGEVTPDYIFKAEAAERIHRHLPDAQLILSLRNPVERLYSMYAIRKDKFAETAALSFEEWLDAEPIVQQEGNYADYLEVYFNYFPREQIKIVLFDELKDRPELYLQQVYRHIGVDESFVSPLLDERINRAGFMKHSSRFPGLFKIWRLAKKMNWNKTAYRIERFNSTDTEHMNETTRKRLRTYYRPKNVALAQLTGLNVEGWNDR